MYFIKFQKIPTNMYNSKEILGEKCKRAFIIDKNLLSFGTNVQDFTYVKLNCTSRMNCN